MTMLADHARRGHATRRSTELVARIGTLDDRDVEAGSHDLAGLQAFGRGEFAAAATRGSRAVAMSDYNAPYILPRVAVAVGPRARRRGRPRRCGTLDRRGTRGRVRRRRPGHGRGGDRRARGRPRGGARRVPDGPRGVPRPRAAWSTRRCSGLQAGDTLGAARARGGRWLAGARDDPDPAGRDAARRPARPARGGCARPSGARRDDRGAVESQPA